MIYLKENCRLWIVMFRFREIASVRWPGTRFWRRQSTPKGLRPGTWSRRWTVNLVTVEGARRAIAFMNWLFQINFFKILKFSMFSKKKYIPKLQLKSKRKQPEIIKKSIFEKCFSVNIWRCQKLSKKSIWKISNCSRRSKSKTIASQRLRISEDTSNTWFVLRIITLTES